MAYIDEDEFTLIFGAKELLQLTDRDRTGSVNSEVFDSAVDRADGLINDYLRQYYTIPFIAPFPLTIINIASAITRYELYSLDPRASVTELYEEALKMLQMIVSGEIVLDNATKIGKTSRVSTSELRRV